MTRVTALTIFFLTQKTAYEMPIRDWSSDVCSSDLHVDVLGTDTGPGERARCSTVDAQLEQVRTPDDLVGRLRVSLRSAQVHNGWVGEVVCPLKRGDDHGRPAVGFQAPVELSERLGEVGRGVDRKSTRLKTTH